MSSENVLEYPGYGAALKKGAVWGLSVGGCLGSIVMLASTFDGTGKSIADILTVVTLPILTSVLFGGIIGSFIALLTVSLLHTLKLANWLFVFLGSSILSLLTLAANIAVGWIGLTLPILFLIRQIWADKLPEESKQAINNGINTSLTYITIASLCYAFYWMTGIDVRDYLNGPF